MSEPRFSLPEAVAAQFDDESQRSLRLLRRDLHRHPELSFQEHRTAERLREALESLAPVELDSVAETGLVARIAGSKRDVAPVAVRGDIDALPIEEDTGLEFSSMNPGVMHACGHDVHASWAVGAARLLSQSPARGDVLIVLQPAEEIGQGAARVLESGVLEGVAAIFGGHVDRRFALGEVVAQTGAMGAAADVFEVTLHGRGGHGARPHLGHDPVVAAAALVTALQTIVSRRVDPAEPAVVTVGSLQAGTAQNVIPDQARLSGTLRSMSPTVRTLLQDELRHTAEQVAVAHRVVATVEIQHGTPPVINTPLEASHAREAASQLLGAEAIVPMPGVNMGGEDFAVYLEAMPGAFLRIGAREADGEVIGAHTPQFYAAEESLFVGAAVLAEAARRSSAQLAVARP